jgi:ketosteroid isomerase-like protein
VAHVRAAIERHARSSHRIIRGVNVAERIRALTEEWSAAARDRDRPTLERLISEDFIFTSSLSSGGIQTRAQYIAFIMNVLAIETFSFSDFRVRQWGTTAVVHARYHQLGTILGQRWPAEFLLTDVWIESGGAWHAVTRHSSKPLADPEETA